MHTCVVQCKNHELIGKPARGTLKGMYLDSRQIGPRTVEVTKGVGMVVQELHEMLVL